MKKMYVTIVALAILVVISGMFFIFNGDLLQKDFYVNIFSGDEIASDDGDSGPGNGVDGTVSGGGSDEVSDDEVVVDGFLAGENCSVSQIPYSIKNFEESVVCQEYSGEDCVSLVANCSVEIYNLDDDSSGDFEIRYALLDNSGNKLETNTLSRNIVAGEYEMLSIDFVRSDASGVDEGSSCFFSMIGVPLKEVCE